MSELDPRHAAWVIEHADGDEIVNAVGLRAGGAPWLLTLRNLPEGFSTTAVLRVGAPDDLEGVRTERAALIWADAHGISVPLVLSDEDASQPLIVIQPIGGSSTIPIAASIARLEFMGEVAARIHAAPPPALLPRRLRSVTGMDFAPLWDASHHPLLERARRATAGFEPDQREDGFVHGDLWMGNVMWEDDLPIAVIDWDCAGRGPAGVDLGSARCDAATGYGERAEDDVLRGWEREAGRQAEDLAVWDVVAALCTPPDMGWFTTAIQEQGRSDLTRELLVDRRDAFLGRALDALGV